MFYPLCSNSLTLYGDECLAHGGCCCPIVLQHLGEHGAWCKQSNFEAVARVPLIIHTPDMRHGGRTASLVEMVDLMPTLLELAGIRIRDHTELEGTSLVPLLKQLTTTPPAAAAAAVWTKNATFTQYPRCCGAKNTASHNLPCSATNPFDTSNQCTSTDSRIFYAMGYSIRTAQVRKTPSWPRS